MHWMSMGWLDRLMRHRPCSQICAPLALRCGVPLWVRLQSASAPRRQQWRLKCLSGMLLPTSPVKARKNGSPWARRCSRPGQRQHRRQWWDPHGGCPGVSKTRVGLTGNCWWKDIARRSHLERSRPEIVRMATATSAARDRLLLVSGVSRRRTAPVLAGGSHWGAMEGQMRSRSDHSRRNSSPPRSHESHSRMFASPARANSFRR